MKCENWKKRCGAFVSIINILSENIDETFDRTQKTSDTRVIFQSEMCTKQWAMSRTCVTAFNASHSETSSSKTAKCAECGSRGEREPEMSNLTSK